MGDTDSESVSSEPGCVQSEQNSGHLDKPSVSSTGNTDKRPQRKAALSLIGQESKVYQLNIKVLKEINVQVKAIDFLSDTIDAESAENVVEMLKSVDTQFCSVSDLYNELVDLTQNKVDEQTETMFAMYKSEVDSTKEHCHKKLYNLDTGRQEEEELIEAQAAIERTKQEMAEQQRIFEDLMKRRRAKKALVEAGSIQQQLRQVDLLDQSTDHTQQVGEDVNEVNAMHYQHPHGSVPTSQPSSSTMHQTHQRNRRDESMQQQHTQQDSLLASHKINSNAQQGLISSQQECMKQLGETIAASLSRSSTKKSVEPEVFAGNTLDFMDWQVDLDAYLKAENIEGSDRLRHLKKYVKAEARKCIDGYFLVATADAYELAREKLRERYGNQQSISRSFRQRLAEWPRISARDGQGLRELGDFLCHIRSAMSTIPSLEILNDCNENEKMIQRLPDWLRNRWARKIARIQVSEKRYPDFCEFTDFIQEEAHVMTLPISLISTKENKDDKDRSTRQRVRNYQTSAEEENTCLFCKRRHKVNVCYTLQAKPYEERVTFVKEHNLCFTCLTTGHRSKTCRKKDTCKRCNRAHPTVLHDDNWKPRGKRSDEHKDNSKSSPPNRETKEKGESKAKSNTGPNTEVNVRKTQLKSEILSMAVPVYVSSGNKELLVYALLDTQSDSCFVTKTVANIIESKGESEDVVVCTLNGETTKRIKKYDNITIRGYMTDAHVTVSAYEQDYITCKKEQIPTKEKASRLDHLSHLGKEIPSYLDIPVGLLIGSDCPQALTPLSSVAGGPGETFAMETIFGWTLCGGTNKKIPLKNVSSYKTDTKKDSEILNMLERDFKDAEHGIASQEDILFTKMLTEETAQNEKGTYVLPLPFKNGAPTLPDNRPQAEKRLAQLIKKLKEDKAYKEEYVKFMEDLLQAGHAEECPATTQDETTKGWYIPHFGVRHPKKKKLRVVFDASAKYRGISLNDTLLQGPDHINSLVGILCRFRKESIAICCDIQQMFYNFHVPVKHRNFLKFLWTNEDFTQTKELRMKVHTFGATSSPGVATFGLRKLATDYSDISKSAAQFLLEDFYVDDGITSVANRTEAIELIKDSRDICSKGNIRLHKFVCNEREVLASVPTSERSESVKSIDLFTDKLPNERTLGLEWDVNTDEFHFTNNVQAKDATKRGLLSSVAQIYDPLGLLAPFILKGKQLLQICTSDKQPWDEPISPELKVKWDAWLQELQGLVMVRIPRCVKPHTTIQRTEIHHFSDASLSGYGACSYLRYIDTDSKVHCALIFGKARVSPMKSVTVPRMELQAAVIATRQSILLRKELKMPIDRECFWTDSRIVLGYLSNDTKRFHMYVANRVQEIKETTTSEQWAYVCSKDNPADTASRGASISELKGSSWLDGPEFLKKPSLDTYLKSNSVDRTLQENDPEVRSIKVFSTSVAPTIAERFDRFSSYRSLLHSVAILKQIARTARSKQTSNIWKTKTLTTKEIHEAEVFVIKTLQAETYSEEVKALECSEEVNKSSVIAKLNPYMDKDGLLRVGGRIRRASELSQDEKFPIIIAKRTHIARLIIRNLHDKIHHLGQRSTLAAIREAGFWITNGTSMVKTEIGKCVTCARLRKPLETQRMGELPAERLERTAPFSHVGMDVFGPFEVKDRRTVLKRWGVLFTCLYSRGVHIEMIEDLSSDSFINALRCLIYLRGQVTTLYSDQGTNFIGAKNLLQKELESVKDKELKAYLLNNRIEFKMNTPSSSHQGGVWERLIRSTRAVLNGMALKYKGRLDSQTLRTAFCEVASILNSQPLTATEIGNPEDPLITPNHLLTGKTGHTPAPPPGEFSNGEIYGNIRWKKAQQIADEFWKIWRSEYISHISQRQKWTSAKDNIKEGDVVLLKDDNLHRNLWSTGIVDATQVGDDGKVRKVTLRLANKNLNHKGKPVSPTTIVQRPVQKLVLLLRA
ncbi:uncharacterized protein [Watersipora subatra]|uniref:uncharacterized protein n=1 Tax=Watersipora subatra TaxID=2589382 RepID=UPI00355B3216